MYSTLFKIKLLVINVEYAVNMSLKHVVAMSTKIVNNITYQWMNAQQGQHKFKSRSTIAYPIYNRKFKSGSQSTDLKPFYKILRLFAVWWLLNAVVLKAHTLAGQPLEQIILVTTFTFLCINFIMLLQLYS